MCWLVFEWIVDGDLVIVDLWILVVIFVLISVDVLMK